MTSKERRLHIETKSLSLKDSSNALKTWRLSTVNFMQVSLALKHWPTQTCGI